MKTQSSSSDGWDSVKKKYWNNGNKIQKIMETQTEARKYKCIQKI